MKRSKFNPMPFTKLWTAYAAVGEIPQIREKINAPDFKGNICKGLSGYIYERCETEAYKFLVGK